MIGTPAPKRNAESSPAAAPRPGPRWLWVPASGPPDAASGLTVGWSIRSAGSHRTWRSALQQRGFAGDAMSEEHGVACSGSPRSWWSSSPPPTRWGSSDSRCARCGERSCARAPAAVTARRHPLQQCATDSPIAAPCTPPSARPLLRPRKRPGPPGTVRRSRWGPHRWRPRFSRHGGVNRDRSSPAPRPRPWRATSRCFAERTGRSPVERPPMAPDRASFQGAG